MRRLSSLPMTTLSPSRFGMSSFTCLPASGVRPAPPLLDEGLAVWLQETDRGKSIDAAALPWVCDAKLKLPSLLKREVFFSSRHRDACYILAGSFTGFLLRQYGWQSYRKLFQLCDGKGFEAKFEKCFAVSLKEAERQWRCELLTSSPDVTASDAPSGRNTSSVYLDRGQR